MPAPVVPSDFCSLTPTPSTEPCEAMKRIFFEQPALICELLQYMFDANGNPQDQFMRDISLVPVGAILDFAGGSAPEGWLLCDGSEVSRTTYADLFAVIGTVYGSGDGATTFTLPNTKGKVTVGRDPADADFSDAGDTGGAKTHTLALDETPAHTHSLTFAGSTSGGGQPTAAGNGNDGAFGAFNTTSAGGGSAHNNLQPFITFPKIIKF